LQIEHDGVEPFAAGEEIECLLAGGDRAELGPGPAGVLREDLAVGGAVLDQRQTLLRELAGGGGAAGLGASEREACVRMMRWTVEPLPASLSAQILPPINSARRLQIARPRPVPPNCRVVELSTWESDLNSRSILLAGMPMPVSRTEMRMKNASGSAGVSAPASSPGFSSRLTAMATSPLAVNFTALLTRLIMTWRRRVTSPWMSGRRLSSTAYTRSSFFSAERGVRRSSASSRQVRSSKGCRSKSSLPASIFEKSRMSLMIFSSESAALRTVSTKSRCSLDSSASISSEVMPMMPFIGMRISWLVLARNSDLARLASSSSWFNPMSAVLLSKSCC
jgi:hypothetical protein